ncbi:MAG: hypothetical protein IT456_13880 [Planctomycetes bacterium]|nr:hypothetical protein [Planctomycetota bacterium]
MINPLLSALLAAAIFAPVMMPTNSHASVALPAPAANLEGVYATCALTESLTFPVFNILCPSGGNCIDVTVTGITAGASFGCPISCKGTLYDLKISRNVCPGQSCCIGDIDVDATGQAGQVLALPPATVNLSIGGATPGCGGSALTVLWVHCHLGNDLLQANLTSSCGGC